MVAFIPFTPLVSALLPIVSSYAMVQNARTAILFITNSESGQANIILALVAELPSLPNAEVHVASFAALEKRVSSLFAITYRPNHPPH